MDKLNWWRMLVSALGSLTVLALIATPTAHAGPYEDGLRLLRAKDYPKAATAFRAASARGHAAAERELGFLYYKGNGVRQNIPTAVTWFEKSAMRGDLLSQTNLAKMYENGIFVARNDTLSAKYFAMAAEQGDRRAQLRWARCAISAPASSAILPKQLNGGCLRRTMTPRMLNICAHSCNRRG